MLHYPSLGSPPVRGTEQDEASTECWPGRGQEGGRRGQGQGGQWAPLPGQGPPHGSSSPRGSHGQRPSEWPPTWSHLPCPSSWHGRQRPPTWCRWRRAPHGSASPKARWPPSPNVPWPPRRPAPPGPPSHAGTRTPHGPRPPTRHAPHRAPSHRGGPRQPCLLPSRSTRSAGALP